MTGWGQRWSPLEPEDIGKVICIVSASEAETCGRLAAWSIDSHCIRISVLFEHAEKAEVFETRDIKRVIVYGGRSPSIHTNPAHLPNFTVEVPKGATPEEIANQVREQMTRERWNLA